MLGGTTHGFEEPDLSETFTLEDAEITIKGDARNSARAAVGCRERETVSEASHARRSNEERMKAVTSPQNHSEFSRYGQITSSLRDLLKFTRRIRRNDSDHVVYQIEEDRGPVDKDQQESAELYLTEAARRTLRSLAERLTSELSFEHLSHDQIRRELESFIGKDQRTPKGSAAEAAQRFVNAMARPPEQATFYFGLRHLAGLEAPLSVSFADFLPATDVAYLRPALGDEVFAECDIYCRVVSVGGNTDRLIERAQQAATSALSLLRLHLRHLSRDATNEQLLFDLHPMYTRQFRDTYHSGCRRGFGPISFGLQGLTPELLGPLGVEGQAISTLPPAFRERVDTALEWLDIAARSSTWKTKLLTIFGAMESLLVPEAAGYKAEVVTVRAAIVEAVTNGGYFTSPEQTLKAYLLRCDLTHGSPTGHGPIQVEYQARNIRIDEPDDLADRCYWWAKDVLSAYVSFARDYLAQGGRAKSKALVSAIDSSETAETVCKWFLEHGASDLLVKYREAAELGPRTHCED